MEIFYRHVAELIFYFVDVCERFFPLRDWIFVVQVAGFDDLFSIFFQ
jgi:hypothetical protein